MARLQAGSDDADGIDGFSRQIVGRHRTRSARADVGEKAVVEQQSGGQSRLRIEQRHQS